MSDEIKQCANDTRAILRLETAMRFEFLAQRLGADTSDENGQGPFMQEMARLRAEGLIVPVPAKPVPMRSRWLFEDDEVRDVDA